ncbi:transmembrane protein, putative (macronuclear) [Tetrahymena thermophila SB210]|uniref:Transmembrane protein, putative n=1 Tax=Tetrahymena thermophila (strain SB210) TaxID=312017 RepID=Q236A5_TETTS|nr:transmembrane protein, putative [Tetrahymena thermophila SB210]EAR92595.2 transmembrane protein, putative [Tetrahymena thermophila SB210]|eukprot:XP_001012840.2 transmembrane protein, putative [Tetrahymena thermophila SB210]
MNQILFSTLICFSFSVFVQACSQFLNKADATLIIPLGQTCLLEDTSIENITLNTIIIEGTLSIKDSLSMNIKYKDLILGQKGSLEIGKDAAIINNLIIFEDVSTQECQEPANTQSIGKINIQSRFMQTYNLFDIYKAQTQIQFQGKPVDILAKQNYVLVNSFSQTEQLLNIQDVLEETLILREPIQEDNLNVEIQRELVIRPILFSDLPVISGVIFKNSCLIGSVEKFQGVTLLNPRGLFLKGGQIQSSLIKIENQDKSITRTIKTEGGFQRNIFYKCQQLNVQIDSTDQNSFVDNNIVSSKDLQISVKSRQFNKNSFINSKIVINAQDVNYLTLSNFRSFNTEIQFLNQENSYLQIKDKSIVYRNKVFQVSKSLDKFYQDDTIFFATTLDLSKSIVNTKFSISNSFFDGNNEVDHLAIFSSNSKQQDINLEYTLAVKFNSFLLTTSDKLKQPQIKYFARISSETLFNVYIKFFKINNKIIDYLPLFNLPMMNLVTYSSREEYNIVEIDDLNTETQNIMYSKIKWAPVQVYQTNSLPTYYQIKNIVTTDNNSNILAKISFDGKAKQDLNLNQYSQLLGDQIKYIEFIDNTGKKLDLQEFTIQLNVQSTTQTVRYKTGLIFPSTLKAIKKVTVFQVNDSKEEQVKVVNKIDDTYQYSYSTIFFWSQSLNQFSLVWKRLTQGFTTYKIKFEYCEENELFDGASCVTQCNTSKMEFFCSKDCGEGYYKDINNPNICLKCPFGCKQCKDNTVCLKCYDFYFSDGQKCRDNCGINQVAYKNSCQKCGNNCGFCYSSEECNVCQGLYTVYNAQCKMCKENQDEYCDECPKNCKSCVDNNTNFKCFECDEGYELIFGQCKKKNTQLTQQSCEIGYSFINGSCQQCSQGCLTCSEPNNSNRCYTCTTSYSQDYFGSSCKKCKGGEYSPSRDSCQSCSQLCDNKFSCFGPSVFQCQKCQAGYFKHLQNNKCLSCDLSKCKECSESPTQCTDCPEGQFLYDKQCFSKCPSGWYPDEKRVCRQCNQELCKECYNSPTQCTECKQGQVLFEEKCYKDCKPGFFADKQNVCKPCDLNKCEECIQYDTKCTKCKGDLYLINHSCEEECPDKGYYFDQNNKCLPCHEDCEKCSGSSTNCTDCEYPMFLEGNKCLQECPPGKYGAYVQSISKCLDCDTKKCQNCIDNKSKCTSCNEGYFLYKNQCMSDCPKGTNKNLVTQSCLVCLQPNCAVCGDNIGLCVQCQEGFIQYQGVCTKECPVGYFLNKNENKCQECDKRVCMECSESPTNCTKCYPEHFNIGNGVCSTTCPKMAYPLQLADQSVCKPCNPTCTKGCVGPLDSECLEAVYITQESNNQAILIGLLVVCFVLLIGLVIVGYLYYKRKQALPYKSYLLKRESQSDIGTVIQMEKTESLKRV